MSFQITKVVNAHLFKIQKKPYVNNIGIPCDAVNKLMKSLHRYKLSIHEDEKEIDQLLAEGEGNSCSSHEHQEEHNDNQMKTPQ